MFASRRNVCGLIRLYIKLIFSVRYLRDPVDNDPVLAAMVMHLQRQSSTRFNHDTLDLETRTFLQNGVGAPRPGNGAMGLVALVSPRLKTLDHFSNVLRARALGHEYGVR